MFKNSHFGENHSFANAQCKNTGIERPWVRPGNSVLSLALPANKKGRFGVLLIFMCSYDQ